MNITGKLNKVFDIETVGAKGFQKRDFILLDDSNDKYPQYISIQLTQDRCVMIEDYRIGDTLTVHFNLQGREWISPQGETKYFNTIVAWKIEKVNTGSEPSRIEMQPERLSTDELPF